MVRMAKCNERIGSQWLSGNCCGSTGEPGYSVPLNGSYDTGRIATILSSLMSKLGHDTYSVIGHDIGMWVAYALAADFPQSVTSLAVTEAVIPGLATPPPILFQLMKIFFYGISCLIK